MKTRTSSLPPPKTRIRRLASSDELLAKEKSRVDLERSQSHIGNSRTSTKTTKPKGRSKTKEHGADDRMENPTPFKSTAVLATPQRQTKDQSSFSSSYVPVQSPASVAISSLGSESLIRTAKHEGTSTRHNNNHRWKSSGIPESLQFSSSSSSSAAAAATPVVQEPTKSRRDKKTNKSIPKIRGSSVISVRKKHRRAGTSQNMSQYKSSNTTSTATNTNTTTTTDDANENSSVSYEQKNKTSSKLKVKKNLTVRVDILTTLPSSTNNNNMNNESSARSERSSASERTYGFETKVAMIVKREKEMKAMARECGIGPDRWKGSLLMQKLKTSTEYSQISSSKSKTNKSLVFTFDPDSQENDFILSTDQTFLWSKPLTDCIRSYYETGNIHVSDDCHGNHVMLALEFFQIVYLPSQMTFDTFSSYARIKLWSDYYTYRDSIADWVVHRLMRTHSRRGHVFVTSPRSDGPYFFRENQCEILDGGLKLEMDDDSQMVNSSSVIFEFFNGKDIDCQSSTWSSGSSNECDSPLLRKDFCALLVDLLPGTTIVFDVMGVSQAPFNGKADTSQQPSTTLRAVLKIDFQSSKKVQKAAEVKYSHKNIITLDSIQNTILVPDKDTKSHHDKMETNSHSSVTKTVTEIQSKSETNSSFKERKVHPESLKSDANSLIIDSNDNDNDDKSVHKSESDDHKALILSTLSMDSVDVVNASWLKNSLCLSNDFEGDGNGSKHKKGSKAVEYQSVKEISGESTMPVWMSEITSQGARCFDLFQSCQR